MGGRVKVADFGLAKAVSADTQHTATGGVIIGTVSYLAPELVVDGTSDARADVYAVGRGALRAAHRRASRTRASRRSRSPTSTSTRTCRRRRGSRPASRRTSTRWSPAPPPATAPSVRPTPGVLLHQLHRVSQALAGGVRDDEELTTDLALPAAAPPSDAGAGHRRHQRLRDPADRPGDPAAAAEPAGSGLRAPGTRRATARAAGRDPPGSTRPRRSRRGPLLLVVALVIALAAGLGAYWFGWARYTATPGVLGLTQQAATAQARPRRLRREGRRPGVLRGRAEGPRRQHRPRRPGARVLDHGTVTLTLSLGKERYAVPKLAGMTVDQAQDALLEAHLTYGRSFTPVRRRRAQGHGARQQPGGRGQREAPGFQVDLIVSKGPRPIHVARLDRQERRPRRTRDAGAAACRSTRASRSTPTGPRGPRHLPGPAGRRSLHRGDTVTLTVSKGPELVQVPGDLRAMGVEAATAAC